ncbi:MAG TPA: YciI family protein [Arenicellales bacterium]|nr:YciI family protein [Arenicellales bacterium]
MKYLCLVYFDEKKLHAVPESPEDSECHAYSEQLREQGYAIASAPLAPVETAATVRVNNGRVTVTDGPFAETKEQLGGFYMIEARDMNEAIQVAEKIPAARIGCIEVRPVRELDLEPGVVRASASGA